jgi:predicted NUDIX family NTP pyrophosphohydrolase
VGGVRSAGLLVYRRAPAVDAPVELLLGHMGGPLWAHRDEGAWSIPKGQYEQDETPEAAASREFTEELGLPAPPGPWLPLGEARQRSGKVVTIWAVEGDLDPADIVPGTFVMRWPPRTGRPQEFPEIDRVEWFTPEVARLKLTAGQQVYVDRLLTALDLD